MSRRAGKPQGRRPRHQLCGAAAVQGTGCIFEKIGEEATEVVLACKDASADNCTETRQKVLNETADLWFHSMVALSHYGLSPRDVLAEQERRVGLSGLDEKAACKAQGRDAERRN
jgi:phosphoribosyl-ATP pyrophosphohydrolase